MRLRLVFSWEVGYNIVKRRIKRCLRPERPGLHFGRSARVDKRGSL